MIRPVPSPIVEQRFRKRIRKSFTRQILRIEQMIFQLEEEGRHREVRELEILQERLIIERRVWTTDELLDIFEDKY